MVLRSQSSLSEFLADSVVHIKSGSDFYGSGIVLGGKYILASYLPEILFGNKNNLYTTVQGKQADLRYIDHDEQRNICVFESHSELPSGIAFENIAWSEQADGDAQEETGEETQQEQTDRPDKPNFEESTETPF